MKLLRNALIIGVVTIFHLPAMAQVEKVAMQTTGISCGMCAAVSEIYLRQLKTVDQITISLSKEAVTVTYKPGGLFQPKDLREALMKTDVGVTQFQISARGRIQEEGQKRFFVSGKDRFVLVTSPAASQLPINLEVSVEGIINDKVAPMELKILTVRSPK